MEIQLSMCNGIKLCYSHTKISICQTNKTEELGNGGENSYSLNQQGTHFPFAHQNNSVDTETLP